MLKRVCVILVLIMCCILTSSCDLFVKIDYGYIFHYIVVGGNGTVVVKDEEDLLSPLNVMGGKKGSREIELIAKPDEGYQVKQWKCNGEIVENNKTNYLLIYAVNPKQMYAISVEFEPIES